MALIDDQADYYAGLLLSEYKNLPRANPTIRMYVKQALGDMLASQLDPAFTLDTAVGPQLDILGKYIGLPRNIGLPSPQPFYEFSDYNGPVPSPNGFLDYLNPALNAGVIWDDYLFQGQNPTNLSDSAYLFMLKMQIVLNSNNGTLSSIMAFLEEFFPGQVRVVDNKNMSVTYYLEAQIPVSPLVLEAYLPAPMGVLVNFVNVNSITGIPSSITATSTGPKVPPFPKTCTSALVTGVPTSGTGPYTYSWAWLSGTLLGPVLPGSPAISATNPNSATTAFTYSRLSSNLSLFPVSVNAVFQLTATDSNGIPFISNPITVTLTAN